MQSHFEYHHKEVEAYFWVCYVYRIASSTRLTRLGRWRSSSRRTAISFSWTSWGWTWASMTPKWKWKRRAQPWKIWGQFDRLTGWDGPAFKVWGLTTNLLVMFLDAQGQCDILRLQFSRYRQTRGILTGRTTLSFVSPSSHLQHPERATMENQMISLSSGTLVMKLFRQQLHRRQHRRHSRQWWWKKNFTCVVSMDELPFLKQSFLSCHPLCEPCLVASAKYALDTKPWPTLPKAPCCRPKDAQPIPDHFMCDHLGPAYVQNWTTAADIAARISGNHIPCPHQDCDAVYDFDFSDTTDAYCVKCDRTWCPRCKNLDSHTAVQRDDSEIAELPKFPWVQAHNRALNWVQPHDLFVYSREWLWSCLLHGCKSWTLLRLLDVSTNLPFCWFSARERYAMIGRMWQRSYETS